MEKKVCISYGNRKMGAIPSVSLPPITTCRPGCPCAKDCDAAKLARFRKTVRESYERNLSILSNDPDSYWLQVRSAASMTTAFRFHVSGDIPDAAYLQEMAKTARSLPGTKFIAFTKQFELVNGFLSVEELPSNLQIIFSAWPGLAMDNPHDLPEAHVIFDAGDITEGMLVCPGNCTECYCRGLGCWTLQRGQRIHFMKH